MSKSYIDLIQRKREELHEKRKKEKVIPDIPGRVRSKQIDDYVFPDHILEGDNITVTDNGDGTLTIAATQLSVEQVQDIVGAFISGGVGISVNYDDEADSFEITIDFTEFSLDDVQAGTTNKHFTSTDESKLDGIEENATADQSDSEIETAYNNRVEIVTQAEAEAGTDTNVHRWTPERVKQAIDALASGGIENVVEDTTPQLGGDLDGQSTYAINNVTNYNATDAAGYKIGGAVIFSSNSEVIKIGPNVGGSFGLNAASTVNDNIVIGTASSVGSEFGENSTSNVSNNFVFGSGVAGLRYAEAGGQTTFNFLFGPDAGYQGCQSVTGLIKNNTHIGGSSARQIARTATSINVQSNTSIGANSMYEMGYAINGNLQNNIAIGVNAAYRAFYTSSASQNNSFIGLQSAQEMGRSAGSSASFTGNTGVGTFSFYQAFYSSTGNAEYNFAGGYNAMREYDTGVNSGASYVLALGANAGRAQSGSNKLYISSTNTTADTTPLIYGEFDNELVKVHGYLEVRDFLMLNERSSDPPDPAEGESSIWQSDGTASGDDGDIMMKITAGATTKTATLVDFSAI